MGPRECNGLEKYYLACFDKLYRYLVINWPSYPGIIGRHNLSFLGQFEVQSFTVEHISKRKIIFLVWDKNPGLGQESWSGILILVWDKNPGLGQEF